MSTVIYPSPVFGPIHSRRLGISLGINLLPEGGKFCSFDCIYCECGLNKDRRTHNPLPTLEKVVSTLKEKLVSMSAEGIVPDVLTFAGNGEPTLHPHFGDIVKEVIKVRDEYCPSAKISVLSNSTQIHRQEVRDALMLFDNNILKLDTVSADYINKVDHPARPMNVEALIDNMCLFHGKLIIQTMFMTGTYEGESVDNTSDRYVQPYIEALKRIRPSKVMIYTIDRETPITTIAKASPEAMNSIAERIRALGIEVSVSC